MNMIGCLDTPTSGKYEFEGEMVQIMDDSQLASIRNRKIGFVFQTFNLLPKATAQHNVEIPLVYANVPKSERMRIATDALKSVGLSDRLHHRPNELSGGQRQRVAIARALILDPEIIIADEPTSMLDVSIRMEILEIFAKMRKENGLTILFITHDLASARYLADRIIVLKAGNIIEENQSEDLIQNRSREYTKNLVRAASPGWLKTVQQSLEEIKSNG